MSSSSMLIIAVVAISYIVFVVVALKVSDKKKNASRKSLINDRGVSYANAGSNQSSGKSDAVVKAKLNEKSKNNIARKLKQANQTVNKEGLSTSSVRYLLIQAGLETPVYKFWIYSAICGVLFFAAATFFGLNQIVVYMITFTGFLGVPRFILKQKVKRRQKKFLSEMPDCLEGMVRLLKSGMPISEAISMVSREFSGPIGEEITRVYESQRIGDTLPEAVQRMAFRVPLPEVKMFSTAITIQVQTGSSLAEVLQNLATVIRQRFRLKRKVQSLSAEAKISAGIIGALPLTVMAGMLAVSPDYVSVLFSTDQGRTMLYICAGWMGVGCLVMREMINFKI